MAGIVTLDGKNHFLEVLFKSTAAQNYYLGLMKQGNIDADTVTDYDIQIGDGLTEVTGTGYARQLLTRNSEWTVASGVATAAMKTFTVGAGGWSDVKGYFIAGSESGADAYIAESFPSGQQGAKTESSQVRVTAVIPVKAYGES